LYREGVNCRIEHLLELTRSKIRQSLERQDDTAVSALASVLTQLQSVQYRYKAIDDDLRLIEAKIDAASQNTAGLISREDISASNPATRTGKQTLKIEIDWAANGKSRERETISSSNASDALVQFIDLLIEILGAQVLEKLAKLRVNRGPLISVSPETDFRNRAKGNLYGHKRLSNSSGFVLTHSSTEEKIEIVKRIATASGFVPGSVLVSPLSAVK
jgi:hypothetical protein